MKKFLLIDTSNLFFRVRYSSPNTSDPWAASGLAVHMILKVIRAMAKTYEADHLIMVLEGRSWRKDFDTSYKRNRAERLIGKTAEEVEEDKIFFSALNDFTDFVKENTNATILQNKACEADDLIAGWIQKHPDDMHVIISGDTDFFQLLADNVVMYDGVKGHLFTTKGVFDKSNKPVMNKKTKQPETIDPEYELFYKVVRGDPGDNVFSAFPGVRETKIVEAYKDRHNKGYEWNNFMMSRWKNIEGEEVFVGDRYKHNKVLVDLKAQPEVIREIIETTVDEVKPKSAKSIGLNFLKLCGKFHLKDIAENPKDFVEIFSKKVGDDDRQAINS